MIIDVGSVRSGARYGWLAAVMVLLVTSALPTARGQSYSPTAAGVPGALLPRNFAVNLRLVSQFFPDIVREASTGRDTTAVGNPDATRAVIYANEDDSRLVTVTVDRYGSSSDAKGAYQEALEKSEAVPGFRPISLQLNVGRQSFAGTVTMSGETHVGLGALDGRLIVGLTLAGFDATPDNFINLVALARAADAAANAADGR